MPTAGSTHIKYNPAHGTFRVQWERHSRGSKKVTWNGGTWPTLEQAKKALAMWVWGWIGQGASFRSLPLLKQPAPALEWYRGQAQPTTSAPHPALLCCVQAANQGRRGHHLQPHPRRRGQQPGTPGGSLEDVSIRLAEMAAATARDHRRERCMKPVGGWVLWVLWVGAAEN